MKFPHFHFQKKRSQGENFQKKKFDLPDFIIRKSRAIEKVFIVMVLISAVMAPFVEVNYDLTEYLPDSVESRQGLNIMEETFGYPGTARVMIKDVTLYEAKAYKDRLEKVDGVDRILWLDTGTNVFSGEGFIDYTSIDQYYKDDCAVMDVIFEEGDTSKKTSAAIDDMKEITEQVAQEFPDKRYIIFDTDVDYSLGDLSNVYSMSYKQNECAFLAGVLAASLTTSDVEYANEDAVIGFVGARDTAVVINDSAVGYIQGAQFVNPDIKVMVSYVGSYVDSATAKELALTQYSSGADCVFVAAGPASVGVIEAAAESQKYVIGVDSDQALAYEGQEEANYIVSSAIKNVGDSLVDAVKKDMAGELPYGEYQILGLEDGVVGLADNDIYQSIVPEDIQTAVNEARDQIISGEIEVNTAYGMDEATLSGIISSAQ